MSQDMRESGFAEPRRAIEQHMFVRFFSLQGCVYGNFKFFDYFALADILF